MSQVPKVRLPGGLEICRILNGMWQVSGYGPVDKSNAVEAMQAYVDAGLTTFDMADHYGPAEVIYGDFNRQLSSRSTGASPPVLQGLTKWVPPPGPMDRKVVEAAVRRSLTRMQVDKLDCVQFHWWDYKDHRYLDALGHLSDLQQDGLIGELALTNFSTQKLEEITNKGLRISSNQVQYSLIDQRPAAKMAEFCLAHDISLLTYGTLGELALTNFSTQKLEEITNKGLRISSNQVQYSLIDQRPAAKMAEFCLAHDISLLTYGTLAGGLLSERYLGKAEPKGRAELYSPSLRKYKGMIDSWGGWGLFQELLVALDTVARRRGCSIATAATRCVLDRPAVGGVIVGCRLGVSEHVQDSLRSLSPDLRLAPEDLHTLDAAVGGASDLMTLIGDCGDEYRGG